MDLARVDLVEDLHQDEGVEHDGVVFGGRGVERRVPATVDVKDDLAWEGDGKIHYTLCWKEKRGLTHALPFSPSVKQLLSPDHKRSIYYGGRNVHVLSPSMPYVKAGFSLLNLNAVFFLKHFTLILR